ncbi:hypothetical protein MMC21_000677 [Puttea exsequens]|nr:hypothetical protein [Puttea exsequens]
MPFFSSMTGQDMSNTDSVPAMIEQEGCLYAVQQLLPNEAPSYPSTINYPPDAYSCGSLMASNSNLSRLDNGGSYPGLGAADDSEMPLLTDSYGLNNFGNGSIHPSFDTSAPFAPAKGFFSMTDSFTTLHPIDATPQLPITSNPTFVNTLESYPNLSESPPSSGASSNDYSTNSLRWHATETRSRAADQVFLYGVLTTKIYCRPSCASRRPARRNVIYFRFPHAIEDAEAAKFRPCKRCKPQLQGTANSGVLGITKVLRTIIADTSESLSSNLKTLLRSDNLARTAELSSFHFARIFKSTTQLTPGDFTQACLAFGLQDALGQDQVPQLLDAEAAVAESLHWRPRTARKALGGIPPASYAKGAPSRNIECCTATTPVGTACAAFSTNKDGKDLELHAVVLGPEAEHQVYLRFPAAQVSTRGMDAIQGCVKMLEETCGDRDSELSADILPALWRARILLRLKDCWE